MFIGDGVSPTGFARVNHSIAKYLDPKDYDICWLAINYHGDPHHYPYRIYPAGIEGDQYGYNRVERIVMFEKPDVIFLLNDAWCLKNYLQILEELKKRLSFKIVLYFPVDASEHDPDWYTEFHIADAAFTYTDFGVAVATEACPDVTFGKIAHGIDKSTFYNLNMDKTVLKKSLLNRRDFYEDSFVILNGNRNQPRKRVDITIQAFKLFCEDKPENVKLYLHMGVVDDHINIVKYAVRLGIDNRIVISESKKGIQTVTEKRLNEIYNACEVGVNTSLGEGWGLVNMEHASIGAPQIVGDHSAFKEIYGDCGILVPPSQDFIINNIMTCGKLAKPEDFASAMELLYRNRELYNKLSEASKAKFARPEYSWENISKQWDTVFKEVYSK